MSGKERTRPTTEETVRSGGDVPTTRLTPLFLPLSRSYVPFSLRSPRVTPILVPLVRYERRENRTRQGNEDVTRKEAK